MSMHQCFREIQHLRNYSCGRPPQTRKHFANLQIHVRFKIIPTSRRELFELSAAILRDSNLSAVKLLNGDN